MSEKIESKASVAAALRRTRKTCFVLVPGTIGPPSSDFGTSFWLKGKRSLNVKREGWNDILLELESVNEFLVRISTQQQREELQQTGTKVLPPLRVRTVWFPATRKRRLVFIWVAALCFLRFGRLGKLPVGFWTVDTILEVWFTQVSVSTIETCRAADEPTRFVRHSDTH